MIQLFSRVHLFRTLKQLSAKQTQCSCSYLSRASVLPAAASLPTPTSRLNRIISNSGIQGLDLQLPLDRSRHRQSTTCIEILQRRDLSISCTNMSESEDRKGEATAPKRPRMDEGSRLIWIDLEMTGLEVDTDTILEIACVVTEGNLDVVSEGPNLVIHHEDKVLDNMGEWCQEHHGKSGLTDAVKNSKISLEDAEKQVLEFVKKHTPAGVCPLAGNSVGMDKRFLDKYMPQLASHFHYRIVDVSTIKELCRRWYPNVKHPPKMLGHRALDDIRESIEELKFYKTEIFK